MVIPQTGTIFVLSVSLMCVFECFNVCVGFLVCVCAYVCVCSCTFVCVCDVDHAESVSLLWGCGGFLFSPLLNVWGLTAGTE